MGNIWLWMFFIVAISFIGLAFYVVAVELSRAWWKVRKRRVKYGEIGDFPTEMAPNLGTRAPKRGGRA